MKKMGAILLSFSLLIALFPQLTIAAQNTNFKQDLAQYLKEISEERGFDVTEEDIAISLSYYDESLETYHSVEVLSEFLGEVIQADLSNLDYIYEEFELDEESLKQLLEEYGEDINDYIFLDDLYDVLDFYTFEQDPNFDQDLIDYLAKVSQERGFDVTQEDIEASLAIYESRLDEFETVEELSGFLGEVIQADLSNLDYFYEFYELDKQALLDLLKENREDINDYIYIDDLDNAIWPYFEGEFLPGSEEELVEELLPIFMAAIDLTEEELQRIENHLLSLEEQFSNPATLEKLEQLAERMMAFEEFDVATELTASQIVELLSIYEEFLTLFNLQASFSLVNGNSESPLSLMDLLNMEELKGANLKIVLSTTDGQFLADMIVTGEMVDSETIVDTGKQIEESAEEVTNTVQQPPVSKKVDHQPASKEDKQKTVSRKNSGEQKTVKGAKLPKTASDFIPNALLGLLIIAGGILMYRKVRKA